MTTPNIYIIFAIDPNCMVKYGLINHDLDGMHVQMLQIMAVISYRYVFPKHSIELGVYKMAWGTCSTCIVAFPPEYLSIKCSGDFYKMPTYRLAIKPWIPIKCLHTGWAKQTCTKFKIYILATSVLLVLASWVRKIAKPTLISVWIAFCQTQQNILCPAIHVSKISMKSIIQEAIYLPSGGGIIYNH